MAISVCILANGNEEALRKTLQAVSGDEVVVVERSGKESTKKIAEEKGAAFHRFEWADDLAGAMSEAIRYASKDWVLFLHAGEMLSTRDAAKLQQLTAADADAYTFAINSTRVVRLFKNFAAIHFQDEPPRVEPILERLHAKVVDAGITVSK